MQWYQLYATGHFGYPQPEDSYALSTYDNRYCDRCAIGGSQVKPFRFRAEPKARNSQFLQLNWVFDEFFVRPEVATVFKAERISGVSFEPVIHNKTNRELETIQQIKILTVLSPALDESGLQTVTCKPDNEEGPPWHGGGQPRYAPDYPYCRRVKYHWPETLRFHSNPFDSAPDIVKTFEWFGSGGSASHAILASERVIKTIEEHRWRGVKFAPVELAGRNNAG